VRTAVPLDDGPGAHLACAGLGVPGRLSSLTRAPLRLARRLALVEWRRCRVLLPGKDHHLGLRAECVEAADAPSQTSERDRARGRRARWHLGSQAKMRLVGGIFGSRESYPVRIAVQVEDTGASGRSCGRSGERRHRMAHRMKTPARALSASVPAGARGIERVSRPPANRARSGLQRRTVRA